MRHFLVEWRMGGGMAKVFRVERESIDEGSDEPDAIEVVWIDSGNVRRHEQLIDVAYGRFEGFEDRTIEILSACPYSEVVDDIKRYAKIGD